MEDTKNILVKMKRGWQDVTINLCIGRFVKVEVIQPFVKSVIEWNDTGNDFMDFRIGVKHSGIIILELERHYSFVHSRAYVNSCYAGSFI